MVSRRKHRKLFSQDVMATYRREQKRESAANSETTFMVPALESRFYAGEPPQLLPALCKTAALEQEEPLTIFDQMETCCLIGRVVFFLPLPANGIISTTKAGGEKSRDGMKRQQHASIALFAS